MSQENKGFDPSVISDYSNKMSQSGENYIIAESEDNGEEFVNFYFIGSYEGKKVVYDAVIYTLRLHHNSEIYDLAEQEVKKRFGKVEEIDYTEDENGDMRVLDSDEEEVGLFMAEVMMELEEEEVVKVQEHVEIDDEVDFGVGLDAGLNVDNVTPDVITKFVEEFNGGNLKLDTTMYSFQVDESISD